MQNTIGMVIGAGSRWEIINTDPLGQIKLCSQSNQGVINKYDCSKTSPGLWKIV
jgi:hypothetical protein